MNYLEEFGWNDFHQKNLDQYQQRELSPGRVISIRGFKYELMGADGPIEAELSGKLLYANPADELPKVGDWVMYMDYTSMGYIIDVLPRMNAITRKNPGERTELQVLAANIDAALVVQGLDRDFNLMRIERYVVQILSCGIKPVVILNKADLVEDAESYRKEVLSLGRDSDVYLCSTYTGAGVQAVEQSVLKPGGTYIMIGSSGVGKSSLLNLLSGNNERKTSAVSDFNTKGKHTTTTRDLFLLKNGSMLIDTPGMREFGVTSASAESESSLFPMIEKFASRCRFNDCTHFGEEGCAVAEAIATGELDPLVYESYVKLVKEQRRFQISAEDKKRMGKQFGKIIKEVKAHRRKYKY